MSVLLLYLHVYYSKFPAYVCQHVYTNLPPLPYSHTFIAIFICLFVLCSILIPMFFVYFLLFPKLNIHLCCGVY